MIKQRHIFTAAFIIILISLISCKDDDFYPKPRGYFRIQLPEKEYVSMDSNLAYTFEYPNYAHFDNDMMTKDKHNWVNLELDDFKGRIHLTYKEVDGNLAKYISDSHDFVNKHIPKANSIKTRKFINKNADVYGLVYDIKGTGAATPLQFYLTDSTDHFMRGVLYFRVKPNNDSLAPVIKFVKKDIDHIIETLQWKEK